jgi:hypothetical protein
LVQIVTQSENYLQSQAQPKTDVSVVAYSFAEAMEGQIGGGRRRKTENPKPRTEGARKKSPCRGRIRVLYKSLPFWALEQM